MCSSPKSSGTTPVKRINTAGFTSSDFLSFASVGNAAEERREEKRKADKERLAREKLAKH